MPTITTSTGATPPRTPHTRRLGRVLAVVSLVLALLILGGTGWSAWMHRAQGTPAAVEMDDARISPAITDAKVVGLGEATHGNAEFQDLRLTVTRKLVDHGLRLIVLEEDFGAVHRVNEYVAGGPGTAEDAARLFGFAINKTSQVAHWLQWMHDHNAAVPAAQQIQLVGMDVQRVDANKEIALGYLRTINSARAGELERALGVLDDDNRDAQEIAPVVQEVIALIQRSPTDKSGRLDALRAATTLADGLRLRAADDYGTTRDQIMFANLEQLVAERANGENQRVLVMGHNGHVAKVPAGALTETVGRQAAERWGDDYRVIGTDFVRTRFLSGNGADRSAFRIHNRTPLRGMFEGTRVGYLEIEATQGANRQLVDTTQMMGSAGEAFSAWMAWLPFTSTVPMVPSQAYDALVLVADATPVSMLS